MKKIKASQLIYAISKDSDSDIEITAIRVNRLCSNLHKKNIYCEFNQMDFEELTMRYPNEISMTEFKVRISPNPTFISSIHNYFRFESNLISNKELQKYWENTDE